MLGQKKLSEPRVPFDLSDLKRKEINDFIRKARAKFSVGNGVVRQKVYKYCPKLSLRLFALLKEIWRKRDVAERWCLTGDIYLLKLIEAKTIEQFRHISILIIDRKIVFGIISKRIIRFVSRKSFVDETIKKAGIAGIPECVEHAFATWEAINSEKHLRKKTLYVV